MVIAVQPGTGLGRGGVPLGHQLSRWGSGWCARQARGRYGGDHTPRQGVRPTKRTV